ncbi:sorting nexin-25 isoform X5 [Dasypus novemcinctus]|uniref:sorting nexin-25 isoform X5 n=1 Tax=Dasypus novemcinctus TaxID=9361 RepID=UPI00265DE978|nr:sorting nexin-25 isoform X5 [Dasypus novemcinctus]
MRAEATHRRRAPGEPRPRPAEDAGAPRGGGGGAGRGRGAGLALALAAAALSCLAPGCWRAGGAGPCAPLLGLGLSLLCAAAALLLGTLLALACRGRRAPPPAFAAAWSRVARRPPGSPVYGNSHESVQSRRVVISHNMDKALKEVFDHSYRDYVLSWYGSLSRDEGQLYHLLLEDFWEIAKQLRHRLSHVDVVKIVCSDVVRTLLTHFCDLKAANARHEEQPRPFVLHACLRNSDDEVRFLQTCSRVLVFCLLPSKDVQSLSLRIMLAEILTTKALKPAVALLSDPDFLNQMLLAQLERREQASEHHRRAYTYAPSYEEFIKLINSSSDVEFLKQLRYQIVVEIIQATTISSFPQLKRHKGKETAAMKADLLRTRNTKRYINQLTVAKKQCEKRIRALGGPAYEQMEEGALDEGEGPPGQKGQGAEAGEESLDEGTSQVKEQASFAVNKLRELTEKLDYKRQALSSIQNAPKPDKKIVSKLKEEITLMEKERLDLQLHMARTDWWCEHLGMWRASVTSGEVMEENGEQMPCYLVMVTLQEVGGVETKHWTVPRRLSEFQNLHRKLSECFPSLKKVQLPSLSKLPFKSIDQKFMEKSKNQLNKFLQNLLSDERLCQSEALYAFLSPSPDYLKVIDVQGKKSTFSFSSFLERLPRDFFSHQEEEMEEDSDLSDYGDDVDGRREALAEPCFMLIGEIFELRGMFKWVRRTLIALVQVTFGRTINRQIRDTVNWIFSEQMLVYYIGVFRDAFWPNGKLAPPAPIRSEARVQETKQRAQQKLLENIPGEPWGTVLRRRSKAVLALLRRFVFFKTGLRLTRFYNEKKKWFFFLYFLSLYAENLKSITGYIMFSFN